MNNPLSRYKARLFATSPPYVLSIFRIVFGLFMIYEIIDYFRIGLVKNMFVLPAINFKYDFFTWLNPLPEFWLNAILILLLVSAVCMTLGIFFKWACRIFSIGYLYLFLLDKSIYNNHIYLFILLAFLFSFTDADKNLSIISNRSPKERIPYWQQFIFQLQFVIVYFYGGIAKLKYDWLIHCQPVRSMVEFIPDSNILAGFLKNEMAVYVFNYGGILIDLGAPLLLWNKNLRRWAIYPFILFHILNSILFKDIGIFPFVMLSGLILFYRPDELPLLRKWGGKTGREKKFSNITSVHSDLNAQIPYVLLLFVAFQLLFPLRGFFLPNDMDWTTVGNRFSWRMKVDNRNINAMGFTIADSHGIDLVQVPINQLVNDMQILNLSMDPRSVRQFAIMLKEKSANYTNEAHQVKANIIVSYNGRPPQFFVDPGKDMASVRYSPFRRIEWVIPVNETNN